MPSLPTSPCSLSLRQVQVRYKQVDLKREKLEMSPVYSTAFEHDGHTLGYIRLVNFSQHAATDMRKAITRLQVRY